MRVYVVVLKLIALGFFPVSVLHLALGPGADQVLGAALSETSASDAVLDSQNRFYGVTFALYGLMLWLAANDLGRYGAVLKLTLWAFFAGGLARLVSIAVAGMPTAAVLVLLALELLLPPLLLLWHARIRQPV